MGIRYFKSTKTQVNQPNPATVVPNDLKKRLGSSIGLPLTFINSDYPVVSGVENVKQDIYMTLSTAVGRRLWQPDFGSTLPLLIFQPINSLLESELITATKTALKTWVPQIVVSNVIIDFRQANQNYVNIFILFYIVGTNAQENVTITLASPDAIQLPPTTFLIGGPGGYNPVGAA